jgi:hypothetical protein
MKSAVSASVRDDRSLVSDLERLAGEDNWAFRTWAARDYSHGLFQYPAMMVPQMQRELMRRLVSEHAARRAYDPFVGSGTTLAEAMLQGLDFVGTDINPLAVLLCRAKSGPFYLDALEAAGQRAMTGAAADRSKRIELDWTGWEKWFRRDVAVDLSKLRRAIRAEPLRSNRRFLWVAIAETVRLVSNSRTSTVKLHTRPQTEIESRQIDVRAVFKRILAKNLERFAEHRDALRARDVLTRQGHYAGQIAIYLHNATDGPATSLGAASSDLLVTSPPYGDNATTVPYGQQAFLPLQWIDLADIDSLADSRFLASTFAIDSMSLGAPTRGALDAVVGLRSISPALDATLTSLASEPPDRARRVAAFWRDLDDTLDHVLHGLAPDSLMAWTVGNRRVGGDQVPMDDILTQILVHRGCVNIARLGREIPDYRKRMASRNSVAQTMNLEQVLVLRSPAGQSDG